MGRHCAVLNCRSGYKLTREQRLKKLLDATKFTIGSLCRRSCGQHGDPQHRKQLGHRKRKSTVSGRHRGPVGASLEDADLGTKDPGADPQHSEVETPRTSPLEWTARR